MRIRKRLHSLVPPPDLSSSSAPSMAPAAAVVWRAASTGDKEGEAIPAAPAGGGLHGSGGSGAGGRGRELHPNGDLPAQPFHGCTTKPTTRPSSHHPPPEAAAAEEEERRDLHPPGPYPRSTQVPSDYGRGGDEVPKREQDGDGDAHRRWYTDAKSGAATAATAPKSLCVEVTQEFSLEHGECKTLPNGVPAPAADATERWSDEEKGFLQKKRRGCYRGRGTRSGREVKENAVAEKEMKQLASRPSKTKKAAGSTTATAAGASTGSGCAPTAAGAGVVVKEEGRDVMPAAEAVLLGDGNRGGGNGKKRRSPAVLMEGSRCSRVNGRGWRCCQQTLVGYSLCEHHLGKGRLRSVSSVRCKPRARTKREEVAMDAAAPSLPSPLQQQQQQPLLPGYGEDEEEEGPRRRRRKKIGMVKARSISSLLHQPNIWTPTAMAAPEPSPAPDGTSTAAAAPPHGSHTAVA